MTDKEEIIYVNPFLRGAAASIDMFLVGFLRIVFIQLAGDLWINNKLIAFHEDFSSNFNEQFSHANLEHVEFLASHQIVSTMLLFLFLIIFVGALYHAILNASSWSATVGKRLMGVILVKNEGKSLTFFQSMGHYALSLVPWVFMVYILTYQVKEKTTLYNAITGDTVNLVLGFITVLWVQIHIFNKKKNTIQDMVIGCSMVKGKVGKKWPKIKLF